MHTLRFFRLIIVLFALGLIGVDQAQGDEPIPGLSPTITWTLNTLDSNGDVGQYASLALDPAAELPHISYFDASTGDMRHAYMSNNPINYPCLTAGWECATWLTSGTDGSFTALDFQSNGNFGILYLNETEGKIYLRGDQGDGIPLANNNIDSINNAGRISHNLRYDRNGIPHVVYVKGSAGYDVIQYAKYVGSGGSCASDAWKCEIVTTSSMGSPIATSLGVTYFGAPRLAIGNSYGLMYANRVTSNGSCSPTWNCDKIEINIAVAAVALHQPICQIICVGPVQIAYYDISNQQLKIAASVESGGNCGTGNQAGKWQCDIIETIGANGLLGLSLFLNDGQPYIAYTDGDDRTNTTLKIANPSPGGNCGPILNGAGTWQCDTIDSGLRFVGGFPFYHNVGRFPTIKINSTGTIYISYYDSASADLLIAEGQLDAPPPPPPPPGTNKLFLPSVLR